MQSGRGHWLNPERRRWYGLYRPKLHLEAHRRPRWKALLQRRLDAGCLQFARLVVEGALDG